MSTSTLNEVAMASVNVRSEAGPVAEVDARRRSTATPGKRPADDLVRRLLSGNLLARAEAQSLDAIGQPLQPSEFSREFMCPAFLASSFFHKPPREDPEPLIPLPDPDRPTPDRPTPERPGP